MKKIYLLITIAVLTFIAACKKDNTIGADLLPSDDLLNAKFSDTFSLNVKTLDDVALRTDKLSRNYLGVITDAKFGFQKASIAMELDRPTNIFDDTLGPFLVDSVVLLLKYNSIYGDTLTNQSFWVNPLATAINESQSYLSNFNPVITATVGTLNNYLYTPTRNPVQTSATDTTGIVGLLRIKLNDAFGQQIMNLGQNTLRDSTLFKNAFNGILVENTNTYGNAMAEIDLASVYSSLNIYYKNKYGVTKQSKLFPNLYRAVNGSITTQTNSVNIFSKTLSPTVNTVIGSGQTSDSINYLLGQGGTLIKINLPTLANLGKVAVNKAVLQITQIIPNTQTSFETPYNLALLKRNTTTGELELLPTSNVTNTHNTALEDIGYIDSIATDLAGNKMVRYSIKMTKYIQNISKGIETNTDLYIATYKSGGTDGSTNILSVYNVLKYPYIVPFSYNPTRFIFAGSNYSDNRYKMKLNLTYTEIK
jgi:hypothetical protein